MKQNRRRSRAEIERDLDHYAKLLGLAGWDRHLALVPGKHGWSARVYADPRRCSMSIEVATAQLQQDEAPSFSYETLLIHELCHVLVSPVVHYLQGDGDQDRGGNFLEEALVSSLATILAKHLPKPPRIA